MQQLSQGRRTPRTQAATQRRTTPHEAHSTSRHAARWGAHPRHTRAAHAGKRAQSMQTSPTSQRTAAHTPLPHRAPQHPWHPTSAATHHHTPHTTRNPRRTPARAGRRSPSTRTGAREGAPTPTPPHTHSRQPNPSKRCAPLGLLLYAYNTKCTQCAQARPAADARQIRRGAEVHGLISHTERSAFAAPAAGRFWRFCRCCARQATCCSA